jgi:hypothetical protein
MTEMGACLLAILASSCVLAVLARRNPGRRRLLGLLVMAPGAALPVIGWAQFTIWAGSTLVIGWAITEAVNAARVARSGAEP